MGWGGGNIGVWGSEAIWVGLGVITDEMGVVEVVSV